ncbi:hypothetical protein [Legionella santicrucis]|nr:hypothetical protein [Legionella santicrucis]
MGAPTSSALNPVPMTSLNTASAHQTEELNPNDQQLQRTETEPTATNCSL